MNLVDDAELDDLRKVGDPLADDLVAHLGGASLSRSVHEMLSQVRRNADPLPQTLPKRLREFLGESAQFPEWADPSLIEAGQHLFSRYGPLLVLALATASLPEAYAAAKGANILYLSMRMRKYTHRRVMETAQFVLDVMEPGGLASEGAGIRSIQKVRLIHALNRPYLRKREVYQAQWGVPVNQEDQLGTLLSFSVVVLDAVKRLGVNFTQEEEEAYLHSWLVIGHLLGVSEAHRPANPEEARELATRIRRRHHQKSEAGCELARALLDFLEQAVPGRVLDGFAAALIRHMAGDAVSDLLDIPKADWTRALIWPLKFAATLYDRAGDHSVMLARASELFSRKVLEGAYVVETGGKPIHFHVPPQLCQKWGVSVPTPSGVPGTSPRRFVQESEFGKQRR